MNEHPDATVVPGKTCYDWTEMVGVYGGSTVSGFMIRTPLEFERLACESHLFAQQHAIAGTLEIVAARSSRGAGIGRCVF